MKLIRIKSFDLKDSDFEVFSKSNPYLFLKRVNRPTAICLWKYFKCMPQDFIAFEF